ncbi:MAG: hypothetical protein V1721_05570 [Pseudomonadota bacterium]
MDRFFGQVKIGVINFFGVFIPGCFFIAIPIVLIAIIFNPDFESFYLIKAFNWQISFLIAALAYVLGQAVCSYSPDILDEICIKRLKESHREYWIDVNRSPTDTSAKKEQKFLSRICSFFWPADSGYPRERTSEDRFPYSRFKLFLVSEDLEKLRGYVSWDKGEECKSGDKCMKDMEKGCEVHGREEVNGRLMNAKDAVNGMKRKICSCRPDLAAINDSNEAHVRMLCGTWTALDFWLTLSRSINFWYVVAGVFVLLCVSKFYCPELTFGLKEFASVVFGGLICVLFHVLMWLMKESIEKIFHRKRVHELVTILQLYHIVQFDVTQPYNLPAELRHK